MKTNLIDNNILKKFKNELDQIINKENYKNETLIMLVGNLGYYEYIYNCILTINKLNYYPIVFCLDKELEDKIINNKNIKCYTFKLYNYYTFNYKKHLYFHYKEFSLVTFSKVYTSYMVLNSGYNILLTDGDIVWLKDPISYIKNINKDIVIQRRICN